MVGLGRFELPTSPLSGVRSNQLSYRPELVVTPGRLPRVKAQRNNNSIALNPSSSIQKGFEDKVERADRLRRS